MLNVNDTSTPALAGHTMTAVDGAVLLVVGGRSFAPGFSSAVWLYTMAANTFSLAATQGVTPSVRALLIVMFLSLMVLLLVYCCCCCCSWLDADLV